uniref:Uncharacterized protein n=1 Tax=Octopus bimaculoides TaxID=37653 RepID=A0A0L8I9D8_OCTBM
MYSRPYLLPNVAEFSPSYSRSYRHASSSSSSVKLPPLKLSTSKNLSVLKSSSSFLSTSVNLPSPNTFPLCSVSPPALSESVSSLPKICKTSDDYLDTIKRRAHYFTLFRNPTPGTTPKIPAESKIRLNRKLYPLLTQKFNQKKVVKFDPLETVYEIPTLEELQSEKKELKRPTHRRKS